MIATSRRLDIPGFVSAAVLLAEAVEELRPRRRMTVAQAATAYRILDNPRGYSGPWLHEKAPYLVRPMECLTDERYSIVAIQGPGQCGKSEVGNNWILHTAIVDPATLLWCSTDKSLMRDYVISKINPMIRLSRELRDRLLATASADNIFSKQFRGGTVFFIWPVPEQFRMRSAPLWVLDDFDDIPQDIGGQGSPIRLLGARQTTFEGREKGLLISSPALGVKAGIEAQVALGTDERFCVPCPHCGEFFAPDLLRDLHFNEGETAVSYRDWLEAVQADGFEGWSATPEEAQASAVVVCPNNGCVIEAREKEAMLARGAWVGPGQTVQEDGTIVGAAKESRVASFRIDGLIGFRSWGLLAAELRAAEHAFEIRQDEGDLRAFINAQAGQNFEAVAAGRALEAEDLEDRRDDYPMGVVPPGVEVLTAAVDTQGNRFEVLVKGWGPGFESWLIDRFAVRALDDGRTALAPGSNPEHWRVLLRHVIWRRYPLATDPAVTVPILNIAIDSGGIDDVSENAGAFWNDARLAGVPDTSIMLIKGGSQRKAPVLSGPTYLEKLPNGKPNRDGAKLWILNVHRIKDMVDRRLRLPAAGPGFIHHPADVPDYVRDELTAEEKINGVWEKIRKRNETWDLEVYNVAALARHAGDRSDMAWLPDWARVPQSAAGPDPATPVRAATSANAVRRPRIRVRGGR